MQEIEEKIRIAKQSALEDELRHIEEKLEPKAAELARQWLRREGRVYEQELKTAELDRRAEESILRDKVQEVLQRLDREQKKNEQRNAVEEEERRRTEQDALRKAHLDQQLEREPEEQTAKGKNIFGKTGSTGATITKGQLDLFIFHAKELVARQEFQKASAEVARVLEIDSTNQEALFLQRSIAETLSRIETAPSAEVAEEEKIVQASRERTAKKGISKPIFVAVGVVLLATAVVMFFQFRKSVFLRNAVVAVLPFRSQNNNPDENVIGSSLAQEVVDRLGHFKSVTVMGFASSLSLDHSKSHPVRAVCELGFPLVLSGAIRFDRGKYLLDAKLVDSSGSTQWSHLYEKTLDQMAFLPAEIVRHVTEALGTRTDGTNLKFLLSKGTTNGSAYVSYLRGLELLNHRDSLSERMASQLFLQAFGQDKQFVQALARASLAIACEAEESRDVSEKTLESAEQLSQVCIELDSSIGDSYLAQGKVLALKKQFQSALKKIDEALVRYPRESDASLAKARVYLEVGKYDDATDVLYFASQRDPDNVELLQLYAFANQIKGNSREAMRYHEIVLSLIDDSTEYLIGPVADVILFDPELTLNYGSRVAAAFDRHLNFHRGDYIAMYRFGRYLQLSGKDSDAAKEFDDVCNLVRAELRVHPQNPLAAAYLALALTRLGRFSVALQIATKAAEIGKTNAEVLYKIAQVYSLQKKREGLRVLHNAASMAFEPGNIVDADFYNFRDDLDYGLAIQMPLK